MILFSKNMDDIISRFEIALKDLTSIDNIENAFYSRDDLDLMLIYPSTELVSTIKTIAEDGKKPFFNNCYYSSSFFSNKVDNDGLIKVSKFENMNYRDRKFAMIVETENGFIGRGKKSSTNIKIKDFLKMQCIKSTAGVILLIDYETSDDYRDFWIYTPLNYNKNYATILTPTEWAYLHQTLKPKPKDITPEDPKWLNLYLSHIRKILSHCINEKSIIDEFLDEKYNSLWIKAVTHITKSFSDSYESIEWYGDGVSKFSFQEYMVERFGFDITQQQSTEFKNQYQSAEVQSTLSLDIRLDDWIIYQGFDLKQDIKEGKNTVRKNKVLTDLLESFSGCVARVGNQIDVNCGILTLQNFTLKFSESLPFNKTMVLGIAKTQIYQLGEKLGFKIPQHLVIEYDKSEFEGENYRHLKMYPTTAFIKNLVRLDKKFAKISDLQNKLTVEVKSEYRDLDDVLIYDKAYELLLEKYTEIGLTNDFVNSLKVNNITRYENDIKPGLLDELAERGEILGKDWNKENIDIFIPNLMSVLGLRMINFDKAEDEVIIAIPYKLAKKNEKNLNLINTINAALQEAIDKYKK